MACGALIFGVPMFVLIFTTSHAVLAVAAAPLAIGGGVLLSLPYALLQPLMPEGRHGLLTGFYSASRGVGVMLGPLIAGLAITAARPLLTSTQGYSATWGVCGVATLASLPLLRRVREDDRADGSEASLGLSAAAAHGPRTDRPRVTTRRPGDDSGAMARRSPRLPSLLRQAGGADPFALGSAAKSRRSASLTPRTQEADRVVGSVCPYCAVGCGQKLYVKDERVVQIEGDPDSRSRAGGCARAAPPRCRWSTPPPAAPRRCTARRTPPTGRRSTSTRRWT